MIAFLWDGEGAYSGEIQRDVERREDGEESNAGGGTGVEYFFDLDGISKSNMRREV